MSCDTSGPSGAPHDMHDHATDSFHFDLDRFGFADAPRTHRALKAYIAHRNAGGAAATGDGEVFERLYRAVIAPGTPPEPGAQR